ncbi:hypothetical protein CXB51_017819 [Gossypium anomalum]|uniref:UBN2 domain-containing protein n=1 Tax=Gossypium anomalum TaxID=47600 RepID=A0A8J6CVY7_9ROSI|nr:hypothetical protein CXB51_017819 [Gossypium anomalum]
MFGEFLNIICCHRNYKRRKFYHTSTSFSWLLELCSLEAQIRAFIMLVDSSVWEKVEEGWRNPKVIGADELAKPKEKNQYTPKENKEAQANSKTIYAIFSGVDMEQFKMISTCKTTKEVWTILQNQHERNTAVRMSKLQILTTKFENMKMNEDELFFDFYTKLCDISNEAFYLGEHFFEVKLVKRFSRSLLQ